jgi:hypothetical protein
VRNRLTAGDIVVFLSFRKDESETTEYRLCAVATVEETVSQFDVWRKRPLAIYRQYLNLLIRPGGRNHWVHYEPGLPRERWHGDWLWRLAEHSGRRKADFTAVHQQTSFIEGEPVGGRPLTAARNYVIFSRDPRQTAIVRWPPVVALAKRGDTREQWLGTPVARAIRSLTVGLAKRGSLRSGNRYRAHSPPDRLLLGLDEARYWRRDLIGRLARPLYRPKPCGWRPAPTRS